MNVEVQTDTAAPLQIDRGRVPQSVNGLLNSGQAVMVAIRPEEVSLWGSPPDGRRNLVSANLRSVQFLGDRYEYTIALGSDTRVLVSPAVEQIKSGDKVYLELKSSGISLWPREASLS